MNQGLYQLIFNAARGSIMVVAETAQRGGKGHASSRARSLGVFILSLSVLCSALVQAQIVADPTAAANQRPSVLNTANGLPLVNIQTPSSAGVSRNTYSQFDVTSGGAVLNNSRTNVQTQLGGWVQGNPWLATGSARVIVNEVNSANPSQLGGFVEVAGQRAEVVIANPAGINVNGAGFINASGVTLSTGAPVFVSGNLDSYRVQGGSIGISGNGLDTRSADYTAVLARAVQANAGVWAKDLKVITGTNQIDAASLASGSAPASTPLAGTAPTPATPAFALDVGQLGGMYAGKITLIGTEAGLGVRNAGLVQASSGALTLSSEGWLQNSGTLQASGGDVSVQTRGSVEQSGTVYSDRNVQLSSQANQTHSGTTGALRNVNIQATGTNTDGTAAHIQANQNTVWAAGLQTDGQLTGQQNLTVQASGQVQTAGQVLATSTLSLQGASMDVSQSHQQALTLQLQATTGNIAATNSQLLATGLLQLTAPQALITDGAKVQAGTLGMNANSLSNVAGQITQTGTADQTITLQGSLNNTAGVIQTSANKLDISAPNIDNTAGQLLHAGTSSFRLSSQGQLLNLTQNSTQLPVTDGGRIVSNGTLSLASDSLSNSGSIVAAHGLSITTATLTNSGSMYAADQQTIKASGAVTSSGTIAAAKDLTLTAASLTATGDHVLAAGMAQDGKLTGTGALSVSTTGTLQSAGQALATGNVTMTGARLDLSAAVSTNTSATSVVGSTAGDVSLSASSGNILTRNAQVSSPGLLSITANGAATQTLDNTAGQLSGKQLQIHVGQLNNIQGAILQTGTGVQTASIRSTGAVTNTDGAMVANAQDLTISAGGTLDNRGGQIGHAGAGSFNLSTAGTDNTHGKILGNAALTFMATGDVNNSNALVAAQSLSASATGWNNSQGKLVSTQADLGLHTTHSAVNNSAGLIQSAQDLRLTTEGASNALQNNLGKIVAARDATLSTGPLTNQAGLIAAGRQLGITSSGALNNTAADNRSGLIYSGADLTLQATSVDNSASQILAVGNATLNMGRGSLTNTAGLVRVGQTLAVQAASVDNTHTRAFNSDGTPQSMGLEGNGIVITTASLNNTQGAVRAGQDLSTYSDSQITNDQGELSAGRNLQINTAQATLPSLSISNQAGQIVADRSVNVRASSLAGVGTIASRGDVTLSLQGDHTLAGTLQAGGNLSLSATGQITNPISVQAGKDLSVSANKLDNRATGELLSGQATTLSVTDTLTNRGLIDGADTRIQAGTVNNLGTGRIYGDRVAIAAATLSNQEESTAGATIAATIAGRQQVDLGVQTLTNRENALLYSGGDMAVGGALNANWRASGAAQSVNNQSATIEAAQNLSIQASSIRNTNEHFATQVQQIRQTPITQYQHAPGDVISASDNSTRFDPADVSITNCEALCMTTVAGTSDAFVQYNYTRTVDESVITQSAPGKILAGGSIGLVATHVLNDKSQIVAGGTLNVQTGSLDNVQGDGTRITTDAGTATSYWRRRRSGTDTYSTSTSAYNPAAVTQGITLSVARYKQNTANASTGTAPTASTLAAVQAQASSTGTITATTDLSTVADTQATAATGATLSRSTTAQSGSGQTQVRTLQPGSTVPNTSLYRQHPEPGAKYLVETDPQFTQYKTWLGSDYMLSALNLDPAATQKRLGDGFYEQKLVRDQVLALTGNRFLGNYQSDEQQYMALMNSGLTYASQWNLRPGIALTPDQIAQLTSDMVWLVTQEVTLADGSRQSVLVPQVYVRVKPGDLDGSGALLAGADVNLNLSGDLSNSGTIAGRNAVQVSADNIRNLAGTLSGDSVSLNAKQDIDNIGGLIEGASAAVAIAGRDINLSTTTQSSFNTAGANSFAQTGIDRVAGLYVKGEVGTLVASAGRDLNLSAAQIGNAGSGATVLAAGNNLNLSAVSTGSSQSLNWDANNRLNQSSSQDVGTQINTGGSLILSAGNDLSAKAATVNAAGVLSALAGHNINITAGQATQSLDEAHQHTSSGFLSSSTTTTRNQLQSTSALASNFEGASVNINAGQDLNVKGSNVLADQNVQLNAGGNVSIEAAQNTLSQSSFTQTTKSGLMSGGGIGFTVGSRMQSVDGQGTSTTAAGSTVGSTGGNVTINAGGAYTQTGSDVLTPAGNIDIAAKTVNIQEARETGSQSTEQKFKQSGLSVGLTGGMIDTLQATSQALQGAAGSGSDRNKTLNALIAYGKGSDLYEQGKAVTNAAEQSGASSAAAASGIKVSISLGSASSQSNSNSTYDTSAGSTIKAGGSVNIKATGQGQGEGDLTVQGSNVQAAQDLALSAAKNVNIVASADTEENRSNNKSSSTSVGVSFGVGAGSAGLSVNVAASRGKGQSNSDSTTYTNSQITAGNQVRITSGTDTNIVGGNVTANQVTANVGGNLNIESLQDKAISAASQSTTGVAVSIPIGAGTGSASLSQSKQRSDSNYHSVGEQSSIQAGAGGFQINVKNNTDLQGAVIASTASADKNSLNTGTLTTGDISNSMSASASTSGTSVGTNMLSGKYELGKAVAGNLLNNGGANQSDASTTKTAISAAQVTVNDRTIDTSKESLIDSKGQTVSSDTGSTNRTLAKADVAGLQKSAQEQQAGNMLAFNAAVAIADNGLKKMAKPELRQVFCVAEPCSNDQVANTAKIQTIAQGLMSANPDMTKDQATTLAIAKIAGVDGDPAKADPKYSGSDPNRLVKIDDIKSNEQDSRFRNIQTVPVTVEDLQNLPNDQKINSSVFANGIFNNEQRAAELAVQQTPKLDPNDPSQLQQIQRTGTVMSGSTYLVSTEKSNNSLGEYVTAGIEKLAEILGVPTPAAELKAQVIQALSTNNDTGQTDNPLNSIGHSRATMTDVNTYNLLGSQGFYNPNLKVIENNPAAKQERIEQSASKVTDPANVQIYAPSNDPVPTFVGGYGEGNKLEALKEVLPMATTSYSVHSSPGSGAVGSNSADVNKPFSYKSLNVDQLNQAKQPQTNAILEQVQANPKPVPIAPSVDPTTKLQDQVQKDSNAQMNQLLTSPTAPSASSVSAPQVPSSRLEQLDQFKRGN